MTSLSAFAAALGLAPDAAARFAAVARPLTAAKGAVLFRPGEACPGYIALTEGAIAVRALTAGGRAILMYRVRPGETCVQTLLCLLQHRPYRAEGVAETAVAGVLVPAAAFDGLIAEMPPLRAYVFRSIAARLDDLSRQVERLAFAGLPARLAADLLDRAGSAEALEVTHETLAIALGATREAVSRALQGLERDGLIGLSRGRVRLVDRAGLAGLAAF